MARLHRSSSCRNLLGGTGNFPTRICDRTAYAPGITLDLQIIQEDLSEGRVYSVKGKIVKHIGIGLSIVMVVDIDYLPLELKGNFALKLYDRRAETPARVYPPEQYPSWNPKREIDFRTSDLDGYMPATKPEDALTDFRFDNDLYHYKAEVAMHAHTLRDYITETEVYNRLKDIQGFDVPRLIARIRLPDYRQSAFANPVTTSAVFHVSGILLQFIKGLRIADLTDTADRLKPGEWQPFGDDALRIVNLMSDRGIFDRDLACRNAVVRLDPFEKKLKIMLLDFALCTLRPPWASDEQWRQHQYQVNQERKLGAEMNSLLYTSYGHQRYLYKPTDHRLKLCAEFGGKG